MSESTSFQTDRSADALIETISDVIDYTFANGVHDAHLATLLTALMRAKDKFADRTALMDLNNEMYKTVTKEPSRTQTGMRLSMAEDWTIRSGVKFRRVGWIDQKGNVWDGIPHSDTFDGGSLTPLLIQVDDRAENLLLEGLRNIASGRYTNATNAAKTYIDAYEREAARV